MTESRSGPSVGATAEELWATYEGLCAESRECTATADQAEAAYKVVASRLRSEPCRDSNLVREADGLWSVCEAAFAVEKTAWEAEDAALRAWQRATGLPVKEDTAA